MYCIDTSLDSMQLVATPAAVRLCRCPIVDREYAELL
jgi:hypothetical protein